MLCSTLGRIAMLKTVKIAISMCLIGWSTQARSQVAERVVDISTRPNVTQRLLVLAPKYRTAVAILLAGGHGGLQIAADGSFGWGKGNFLVRSRQLFADQQLMVAN